MSQDKQPRRQRKPNVIKEYTCEQCGAKYPLSRAPKAGTPVLCAECRRLIYRARARKAKYHTRPEYKAKAREWRLQDAYGLTPEDFERMCETQGGVCAICKQPPEKGKLLVVDHDHQSGAVRGILCNKCNRAIGTLNDDTNVIRSAISYLQRGRGRQTWDEYFVEMARLTATRSKDRSSQVGAVIVRNRLVISTGYNGFPRGVNDDVDERHERPAKYLWTVHAEENAILNAARYGAKVEGGSLYVTPFSPCSACARGIAASGISEVIVDQQQDNPRFAEEMAIGREIMAAARVVVRGVE